MKDTIRARSPGEKVDITVFAEEGFFANNPQVIRTEDQLVLTYGVQPMDKLHTIESHHHFLPYATHHWSVSDDGGFTWRTTDIAPSIGRVLDAGYGEPLLDGGMATITFSRPYITPTALVQRGKVGFLPYANQTQMPVVETNLLTDLGPFDYVWYFAMTRSSDGALLAAGYSRLPEALAAPLPPSVDPRGKWTVLFLRSEDEGRSWRYISHIPNPNIFAFSEMGLLPGADGRVLMLMRVDWAHVPQELRSESSRIGYGDYMYQSETHDNGFTWSEPAQLPLWGHPPYLVRLKSDAILLVYGHRRPPHSTRAILSYDEGQTWDEKTMRTLRSYEPGNYDFGYPQATQLEDGTILCAHYGYTTAEMEGRLNPCGIFVSLFDEEWLAQGD